ncbi:MAG: hypothetical protein JRG67_17165 [Deltaproteobacteria bacterium]|nr:hypothetical protein [Deltaproteobacteria bacterium]
MGAGLDLGERAFEHTHLCACLVGDLVAELGYAGGDVSPGEEWALVGVPMLCVEVHELDAGDREASSFDDVGLHGGVGDVLWFDSGGGFDFGDYPTVVFLREHIYRDEDVVFEEGGFEDDGGAGFDGFAGGFHGGLGAAVVELELNEGGARKLLACAFADAVAHVEDGLEAGVGFELGRAWLVDLPPKLAVALEASGEAGFGKAQRFA